MLSTFSYFPRSHTIDGNNRWWGHRQCCVLLGVATRTKSRFTSQGVLPHSHNMGMDYAHLGIRVNAVCPNEVNTPMLRSGFEKRGFDPNDAIAELGRTVPLGRIAEPDDITEVVLSCF